MRKLWLLIIAFIFAHKAQALQIMIDPGHGGVDSGTSYQGLQEKDLVLKISNYLKILLSENPRLQVHMTREKDQHLSLQERVRKADQAQADLFISLHVNSNPDRRVQGTELYFQNSLPPDEENLLLVNQENFQLNDSSDKPPAPEKGVSTDSDRPSKKSDVLAIVEDLQRQHRAHGSLKITQLLADIWSPAAIKQAPFYVVSKTTMPSVLIEAGFLTHPEESKKLNTPKYQQEIAQKIYKAVLQYKEMMDNIEGQALE